MAADTPNALSSVTALRSSNLINDPSDNTLTFTTFNPIPSGSFITIAYPKD
jgi:hypothetical protein